jgi:hypothetical protein
MISLKRIESGLFTYTHTHSDGNIIEYRVGWGKIIDGDIYTNKRWVIAIFSGNQRIGLYYRVPNDSNFRESPAYSLTNWFSNLQEAREVLEKYIRFCTNKDYPSPIEIKDQSVANYRRAARALVDKLVENNFRSFCESGISISVRGGYDANDNYYDFCGNLYDSDRGINDEIDNLDDVVVEGEVTREIVDEYRNVKDAVDDPTGLGGFDYAPIELVDDSKERYTWCMRILAKNLVENNFNPYIFPPNPSADISIEIEPYEYAFIIRANIKRR